MADIAKKWKLAGAGVTGLVLLSLSFALFADYSSVVGAGVPVKFSKQRAVWAVLWRPVANVDQVRS